MRATIVACRIASATRSAAAVIGVKTVVDVVIILETIAATTNAILTVVTAVIVALLGVNVILVRVARAVVNLEKKLIKKIL